jgi:hypothetical protein
LKGGRILVRKGIILIGILLLAGMSISSNGYTIIHSSLYSGTTTSNDSSSISNKFLITDTSNHVGNGWNQTYGGNSYDEGYSVQQTDDGGYIITGGTLSYGAGDWDVWLIKTDSSGNEEWNVTFGSTGLDRGNSVQQTTDGGYIIIGTTTSYGNEETNVWLLKTDVNGIETWNSTFGGNNVDWGYSGQQTTDGGYIIGGYTESYGAGASDVWLIKTNSDGKEVWNTTFGGIDHDRGFSVQQTTDDGYIITGYTVSFDEDTSGCDIWLIKTDSQGVKEWDQTYGGSGVANKVDMAYSVQQTSDDGYIIVGDTEIYFVAKSDVLLIKTDSDGNEEWISTFGGSNFDRGRCVNQTIEGGYIITGWSASYGPGDPDVWLINTDSNGNELWNSTFEFDHEYCDWGYSVQQTKDGGYIVTGATMPDGWAGSPPVYSEEGTDLWLIKVASENQPPVVTIVNPQEGLIHFSGIPLVPTLFDCIAETIALGGFQLQKIQVEATDDTQMSEELSVTLDVEDLRTGEIHNLGNGSWNEKTESHEWHWKRKGATSYRLLPKAIDAYGAESEVTSLDFFNICLLSGALP